MDPGLHGNRDDAVCEKALGSGPLCSSLQQIVPPREMHRYILPLSMFTLQSPVGQRLKGEIDTATHPNPLKNKEKTPIVMNRTALGPAFWHFGVTERELNK